MTLRGEVINLIRPDLADGPAQSGRIRQIAVMKEKACSFFMRVPIQVIDAIRIECGCTSDQPVNFITLFQKEFRKIGTILSRQAGNERALHRKSICRGSPGVTPARGIGQASHAMCRYRGFQGLVSLALLRYRIVEFRDTRALGARWGLRMPFNTLDDLDVSGKTVLVRGDLNVPMEDGEVTDTTRIDRLVPTVTELLTKGASVVLTSHFGRPKGKRVPSMSLRPVADALHEALQRNVTFAEDCIGGPATQAILSAGPGGVTLLENLRFHAGEESDNGTFATALADLADMYVNDAFSAAHRAHASTHAITKLLPSAAGRNMQAELEALDSALGNPEHPVAAIVGGAKVSSKLKVLENLVSQVDFLIIGGGMANTFLFAKGVSVGKSLCEPDLASTAEEIIAKAKTAKCEILLPIDASIAPEFASVADPEIVAIDAVPSDQMVLDIGPESATQLSEKLKQCRTLVWNGPMGAFELEPFDQGTVSLAQKAAQLTQDGTLVSIAGGGDTVAALNHAGVGQQFTYVSTAGGAFLEWMEGRTLPGVAALEQAYNK